MMLVIGHEIPEDTNIGERVTNSIEDEDTDNQECKGFICETSGKTHHTSQVKESSQDAVDEEPNRDPCIEGHVVDPHAIRHADNSLCKGKDWPSRPDDGLIVKEVDEKCEMQADYCAQT